MAARLRAATDWAVPLPEVARLLAGYFGASTGAAAAPSRFHAGCSRRRCRLALAAARTSPVTRSIRSGRPRSWIAGRHDEEELELNRRAYRRLTCPKRLVVIPDATHPLEEPQGVGTTGWEAASWLVEHLVLVPRGGRHGVRPLPVSRRLSLRTVRRRKAPTRGHQRGRSG